MAFTYGDNPAGSTSDELRLLVGDTTDFGDLSLSDAEVSYCLAEKTTTLAAAIYACQLLASRCAKYVDETNIGVSTSASQRADAFAKRAKELRDMAARDARLNPTIFVGGRIQDDVDDADDDTATVQPFFKRKGFDNTTSSNDETTDDC